MSEESTEALMVRMRARVSQIRMLPRSRWSPADATYVDCAEAMLASAETVSPAPHHNED
jgi:hypothetical protein